MPGYSRGFYRSAPISSVADSPPYMLNYRNEHGAPIGVAVECDGSWSGTYTVQYTLSDLQRGETPVWIDTANLAGKTATAASSIVAPATALRLHVTVHSAGSATMVVRQVVDATS